MSEFHLFGVYLSPFVLDLVIAALVFAPIKVALDRLGIERFVWHPALFDVALFVCVVSLVTLAFRTGGWA